MAAGAGREPASATLVGGASGSVVAFGVSEVSDVDKLHSPLAGRSIWDESNKCNDRQHGRIDPRRTRARLLESRTHSVAVSRYFATTTMTFSRLRSIYCPTEHVPSGSEPMSEDDNATKAEVADADQGTHDTAARGDARGSHGGHEDAAPMMSACGLGGCLVLYPNYLEIQHFGVLYILVEFLSFHIPRLNVKILRNQITAIEVVRPLLLPDYLASRTRAHLTSEAVTCGVPSRRMR
ncbi:MAG: hypothetical protein IT537_23355 [Hyphomicrobiales bacterium]|nr:hypothetical protein [Hyphomicrobiales bacterium]